MEELGEQLEQAKSEAEDIDLGDYEDEDEEWERAWEDISCGIDWDPGC